MRTTAPLLILALASTAQADVLADWDFSGLVNPMVNNAPTVNPLILAADAGAPANVIASDLEAVKGSPTFDGLLWADVNVVNGAMNHKYWDGDLTDLGGTAHDGVPDNWIAFTLTSAQATPIAINRLSISIWRNGTGAAADYAFEVVVDGGTPQLFGAVQNDPDSGDFGYDWFDFDDEISFITDCEIRFVPRAAPGGQGTGNLHINGLRVERDVFGTNYCVATSNSVSASGSTISAAGSTSLANMDLTLTADNAPSQPGLFFYGPDQSLIPFGNGFRCVAGQVVRMPVIIGTGGTYSYAVDFVTYGASLANLGTVDFQCWYRDPAGGGAFFNLSDGIEVVFVP